MALRLSNGGLSWLLATPLLMGTNTQCIQGHLERTVAPHRRTRLIIVAHVARSMARRTHSHPMAALRRGGTLLPAPVSCTHPRRRCGLFRSQLFVREFPSALDMEYSPSHRFFASS